CLQGEPASVARTRLVAEACRYTPPLGGVLFPEVELAADESPYSKLCALAIAGAQQRFRPLRPEVLRRLDYELATIQRLGFAPYFLLVHRIARFAAEQAIPSVGRGSAADSLVAYCLRLTDADPFRYRLPFERFLNPSRKDRPDIDLDFCWRRRDEVLEHVFELFGHERTAMICTLNRFGLRSAFREAALAHGIPPAEINPWSGRLPHFLVNPEDFAEEQSGDTTKQRTTQHSLPSALARNPLALALAALPEAHGFPFEDERFQRTLQSAAQLLDTPRHFGLHPGGVVVSPGPVTDFVPCQRSAKGPIVTQLDKNGVEAVGLVKMDLLGNRALTTLADTLDLLRARGIEVDLESLPENDAGTAASLSEGRTLGCFQIESPGMRHLLQQMDARDMDAVIQAVALIRPGPAQSGMKDAYVRRARGLEAPTPPHPRLADVLWDTHGVMLYQEDVMQCAARVAGMDLAEADQLRRALQKRRIHELGPLHERFMAGCSAQGVAEAEASHVWDLAANFASFAFCKAHAVTYGRIAYRAAWLKTHHPAEYMTAFLLSETGYFAQRVYVEEARRLGVSILPPDVNRSGLGFSLDASGGLRVGLAQAKGLTQRTLEAVLAARKEAPFLSLPDFLARTGARKDETLTLIRCGAFDAFDRTRPELAWRLHLLTSPQQKAPRGAGLDPGQLAACRTGPIEDARARTGGWNGRGLGVTAASLAPGESAPLFPEPDAPQLVLPGLPNPSAAERGRLEFELLGLTLEDHPVRLFPCVGEERVRAWLGRAPAPAAGAFRSREDTAGKRELRPVNPIACGQLAAHAGARVTLKGWPTATRRVRTETGEQMRFLTLEDESGLAEAVLFPDTYASEGERLELDQVLLVTGLVDEQMGSATLTVERIW
ncbi:MAG: DNA polymerase-3 subunit alpha, partial [Planctomycetota bacterium]